MKNLVLTISLVCSLPTALVGGLANVSGADDLPFYAALRTGTAPRLDGKLDEACWQHAEKTAPFVAIGGQAVEAETRALVCWGDDALYVAFISPEPRMKEMEERIARSAVGLFSESVELFIDATYDRFTYLQLRVDILGSRDTHRRSDLADELTDQWLAAVSRGPDQWTVELAVPFTLLDAPPLQAASLWGLNVNRNRMLAPAGQYWTCWSDTKGGFHSPDRFGRLVFTDYRAWLRFYFHDRLDAVEQHMTDLVLRYPRVADRFLAHFPSLDQQQSEFFRQLLETGFKSEPDCRAGFGTGQALIGAYEQSLAEMRQLVLRDVLSNANEAMP